MASVVKDPLAKAVVALDEIWFELVECVCAPLASARVTCELGCVSAFPGGLLDPAFDLFSLVKGA